MRNKIKKIIAYFLCLMIVFINLYRPLIVKASALPPIAITDKQVTLNIFQQVGYLISMATGLDISMANDGNPLTRHDFARFGYDYLVSKGFDRAALNTLFSVLYLDPNWKDPVSADTLLFENIRGLDIDEILALSEADADAFDVYVQLKEDGKSIFDTLPDFVSSVLDGTNTLKLGNKTITAENVKGWNGVYQKNADGEYVYNCSAIGYLYSFYNNEPYQVEFFVGVPDYSCAELCAALYDSSSYSVSVYLKDSSGDCVPAFFPWAYRQDSSSPAYNCGGVNQYVKGFTSVKPIESFNFNMPVFGSLAELESYFSTGKYDSAINSSKEKFDYTAIASNVVSKIFPLITGATISVKGLYDAYTGTRDKIKGGSITDTPAYIDSVVNVMQGIQTLDKVIAGEETPTLPDSGADILEWVKTIASAVVVIPTELRKLSLSALESSVASIADVFPALRQDLKAIADSFPALRQDVKTIGDVFPALRSDLKGIADDFPAVRKTLDAIGDSFPALKQGLDSITDVFPSMVDYQARFLPKIGDISDTLNALSARYKELVDSLSDFFPDIRDKLGSILGVLDIPLGGVLDLPLSGIADKVDGISDSLAGLKDFTLTIPDYTGILGKILAVLEAIRVLVQFLVDWFTIDPVLLSDTLEDAVTDIKYSTGLEPLLAFFERFKFTDDYTYPRIVMGVPDYVKAYYPYDEIVLVDFGDYAKYFVYTRTMLKFCLWFTFALVQFKHIKVHYHIG